MIYLFSSLFVLILGFLIYKWVVVPHIFIRFYKKQNIQIKFSPFYCRDIEDINNVQTKADFFYWHKDIIKKNPDLKLYGYQFGTNTYMLVFDPILIKEIFHRHDIFQKQEAGGLFRGLIDKGLIFLNGEEWKSHRKLVSSVFHYEFLKENVQSIVSIIDEHMDALKKGDYKKVDILELGQVVVSDIIGKLFFGENFSDHKLQGKSMVSWVFDILGQMGDLKLDPLVNIFGRGLIDLGIFPKHRKLIQDIRQFTSFIRGIIAKKIDEVTKDNYESRKSNLLDLFCQHALKSKEYDPEDVIPEFNTFLFAGVDSTAHLILMATYYLLTKHEAKQRISEEIKSMIPQDQTKITINDLNQLDIIQAFLKETLRIATPVPQLFDKIATKDFQIGDILFKKGTIILQSPIVANFNPTYYDNPGDFNIDRWLTSSRTLDAIKENPSLFIPFGSGPRHCIGQHLSLIIGKIFLILFTKKFEFKFSDPSYRLKMTLMVNYEPEEKILYELNPK